MKAKDVGKAGLAGWRETVADKAAPTVAARTPIDEDAIRAAIGAELRGTGARPRRIALRGVESLTPSERRVAEMASKGPTNREIAQALFVTPRTVELHLTNTFRKLEISSRSQLAAALREQP
jgi:DNA-binding NarL/FixJ family response regulator